MILKRSELREKVMIILYQIDICHEQNIDFEVEQIIKDNLEIENKFAKDLVYGVLNYNDELEKIANKYMVNWTINRIDKTGACILKMALYELIYMKTPDIVVINEAVELAKKYSDENVRKMINAILDRYIKEN